ncbi:hypothetical protein CEXT_260471 [Caerostris extrusa]|uniref:Uncharacterized protein n=1 Tax=Caerostris extrusa TaxID=172846 RepID=A0AAV4UFK2_CAEEX|nr:hypothetical protein CEXT_260471 [Caerostris extrusa]
MRRPSPRFDIVAISQQMMFDLADLSRRRVRNACPSHVTRLLASESSRSSVNKHWLSRQVSRLVKATPPSTRQLRVGILDDLINYVTD